MSILERAEQRPSLSPFELRRPVSPTSSSRTVVGLVLLLLTTVAVALVATGGSATSGRAAGLADAGRLTSWLLPLSRSVFDLGAIGTVGLLVSLGWLVPLARVDVVLSLRRVAAAWAALWAVAAGVNLLASASQVVGLPIERLLTSPDQLWYAVGLPQGRALLLVLVGAVAVSVWIGTLDGAGTLRACAVGAAALMAPLLTTGHAATASDHFLATESLMVHVVAVTVWLGGLLSLVVHLRRFADVLPFAAARFSRIALPSFVAVALSGLLGAWTRLGLSPSVWLSTYGVLVLVKTAALVLVGVIGWWHRRRTLPALSAGRPRAFARLAGVEVTLMTVTVGLAVVLARTAPPVAASLRAVPPHAARFPTVDATLPPWSPVSALTAFRPDATIVTLLVVAACFLLSWARLRHRSPARAAMLLASVLLALWGLVGGAGAYATSLFSAQVLQLLVLALVVPPLLVRGVPLERLASVDDLLQRRGWRALARPGNALLLLVVLLGLVLQTPLLALTLRSGPGHLVLTLAALAGGLLVFVPMAVTAGQESTYRAGLLVVAGLLGWYAVRAVTTATPAAGGWYHDLDLWWADAAADQRVAGLVMAGAAVVLALSVLAGARRPQRV